MRTLCLNLDLDDAEILRDALAAYLQGDVASVRPLDGREASIRATLSELTGMIERPAPRPRRATPTTPAWRPAFVPAPDIVADAE